MLYASALICKPNKIRPSKESCKKPKKKLTKLELVILTTVYTRLLVTLFLIRNLVRKPEYGFIVDASKLLKFSEKV